MTNISIAYKSTIISFITLILIIITSQTLVGKNYYFSSSSGDDSRTSTQAQNSATPWKSIAKLNATTFLPGDVILFNRGDTFYGSLIISSKGTSGSPITYSAYGTGANPIITGFTNVTAWTNIGNNIWESTNAVSTLSGLNLVTINGVNTPMGRMPNSGYYYFQSHTGSSSITSSDLTGTPNWKGAELAFNCNDYTVKRCLITSQSGSTLTFTNPETFTIAENNLKFIIQNDIRTLDKQNEWYYNPSTKKLRIYSTSTPTNVQVATTDNLVTATSKDYVTFDNISFKGANSNTFSLGAVSYFTVQNCTIDFSGHSGIYGGYAGSSPKLTVSNCIIDHSNNGGIGVSNLFTNATIQSNTVSNSGMIYGATAILTSGTNAAGIGVGISVPSDGTLIKYNKVEDCGYHGIRFYGSNTTVQNNFVNRYCQNQYDGGGIYTINGSNTTCTGTKVLGNIVINTTTTAVYNANNYQMDAGIYCDGSSNGIEIAYNTVSAPDDYGLFMNGGHDINLHDNISFNCFAGIRIHLAVPKFTLSYNVIVAKSTTQHVLLLDPAETIITGIASNNNYFARPIDDNAIIECTVRTPALKFLNQSLSQWQTYSNQDFNSKKSPKSITSTDDLRFEYNATSSSKTVTLDANYIDVKNVSYNGSITLAPYTSAVLIKNGPTTNQPTNQAPSIQNQSFQLQPNSVNGTTVGSVVASDPNAGQTLTYSILSGNTNGAFSINASTGVITVANSTALVNSSGSSNYSIFQSVTSPSPSSNYIGTAPLEVGMKFSSSVNGYISGLRYYKGVGAQGIHIGNLWTSNGTNLASATFTGETASGWQTVSFNSPVAITANTIYVVSYFSPNGDFVYTDHFFTSNMVNGPLTALACSCKSAQWGLLNTSSSAFPNESYLGKVIIGLM